MDVHQVARLGFGREAETYERSRPSYPAEAVAWLVEHLAIGPGRTVVDLAAGTGKLTGLLVTTGARLVAVEPVEEMHRVLRRVVPGIPVVAGTAEALPFRPSSLDAVCVAQAFHWFDADRAFAELARVLRPGGTLAVTVPRFLPEALCWALSHDYHSRPGGHVRIYRASALVGRLRRAGLVPTGRHHAHALHTPYWWLRCAVGVADDEHPWVRAYHRLLVWEITHPGSFLSRFGRLLDPALGKSLVVYLRRPPC